MVASDPDIRLTDRRDRGISEIGGAFEGPGQHEIAVRGRRDPRDQGAEIVGGPAIPRRPVRGGGLIDIHALPLGAVERHEVPFDLAGHAGPQKEEY